MTDPAVRHRHVEVDGIDTFYREAGPAGAPVLLLPHGYPCSSYEFRNLERDDVALNRWGIPLAGEV